MSENLARLRQLTEHLTTSESGLLDIVAGVMDLLPVAVLLVEQDGRILRANIAAHLFFGYDTGALRSLRVDDLVPPAHRARHVDGRTAYFRGAMAPTVFARPLPALRRDGSTILTEIAIAPLRRTPDPLVLAVIREWSSVGDAVRGMIGGKGEPTDA